MSSAMCMLHIFVVAAVCLTVSLGTPIPDDVDKIPAKHTILEGDNLLIACNVNEQPNYTIYWTKNATGSSFCQEGVKLEMMNINRKDAGDYICHAFNTSLPGDNETEANVTVEVVTIDVQYPADIALFGLDNTEVNENQSFTVTCKMEGNPSPVWEIRNNYTNNVIMQANAAAGESELTNVARCQDAGFWMCTGKNKLNHGINATRGQNLTVFCSPRPDPYTGGEMINSQARVATDALFITNVLGYPYPSYTWSRDDGKPIRKNVLHFNFPSYAALTFKNVEVEDYGNYTLTMNNSIGVGVAHFKLTAYGKPEMPYNVNYSDVTYDSVKLTWTSGFDMGSQQHFVVMKNTFVQLSPWIMDNSTNHGIGQNWTYTQTGLVSDTDYELGVVADNTDGHMSRFVKPNVKFRTKPNPYHHPHGSGSNNTWIVVGSTLGGLAGVGILAYLVVYFVKYRHMRTSCKDEVMKK